MKMSVVCDCELPFDADDFYEYYPRDNNNVNPTWTPEQILEWLMKDSYLYINTSGLSTYHRAQEDYSGSSSNSFSENTRKEKRKRGRKPRTGKNHQQPSSFGKLWEFLIGLLHDNNTCPSLIKWHNYGLGTFKFVQGEQVAKLWGSRNNNSNMSYDKLSRAMRYHYRSKILQPVEGQRLVYKFGPNAVGWRTDFPILES